MKYAVVQTGGKQYKIEENQILEVERLDAKAGSNIDFDKILLFADSDNIKIGTPYLDNVTASAKVIDETKGKKIRVAKFKAKARVRTVKGHRQSLTKLQIIKIAEGKREKSKVSSKK